MEALKLDIIDSRSFSLAKDFDQDYILLQVDQDLLKEIKDGRAGIHGCSGDQPAVLCTNNATYQMNTVHTSTKLWLVQTDKIDPADENIDPNVMDTTPDRPTGIGGSSTGTGAEHVDTCKDVVASSEFMSTVEVVRCAPRVSCVRDILQRCLYNIDDDDVAGGDDMCVDARANSANQASDLCDQKCEKGQCDHKEQYSKGVTSQQLLTLAQASQRELVNELKRQCCVCVDNLWRMVDSEYLCTMLNSLVAVCAVNAWNLSRVPYHELVCALSTDGYRDQLSEYVMLQMCVVGSAGDTWRSVKYDQDWQAGLGGGGGGGTKEAPEHVSICEEKIAVQFARQILAARPLPLLEFEQQWQATSPVPVPLPILNHAHVLYGTCVIGANGFIQKVDEREIVQDMGARLSVLFNIKKEWVKDELMAYLDQMQIGGDDLEECLAQHAHAIFNKPSDPVLYTKKR